MAEKIKVTTTPRQKIVGIIFILVIIFILWQIIGMFRGGGSTPAPTAKGTAATAPRPSIPQPPEAVATIPKPKPETLTPLEIELMKLQQETQTKYVAALNQLQMLKIERDIADNLKEIMKAKQETVAAQKGIIDLLAPAPTVPPAGYAQSLVTPTGATPTTPAAPSVVTPPPTSEINYSVISVSFLQNQWNAVLGYQGSLYSVSRGDILPPDGSKVISINRSGVVLQKNGTQKTISMVPII